MRAPRAEFSFTGRRQVRAVFDAGPISSDGGAVLLREADRRLGLVDAIAAAIPDERDVRFITHQQSLLARQRIFGIALGYEDCNDATTLRADPVLKTCCGVDPSDRHLASQPTLSRWENEAGPKSCYAVAQALLESYFKRHRRRPKRIVLDVDLTDDATHGQQEFASFHGFYDQHVYLPLLVFDQDGDLLTAVLCPGKFPGARVTVAVLKRIALRIRAQWPGIEIVVRGDSAFAGPDLYALCEKLKLGFIVGMQPNARLKRLSAELQKKARRRYLRTGRKVRLFKSIRYRALRKWTRSYRVVIKAEHQAIGPNVRYVVTNLSGDPQRLYDEEYVARGEACENSIKDLKNALKADRLSCHRFWANQFRLLLHAAAYILMVVIRHAARGTQLQDAQMDTLRLRLFKIGVRVESAARRIWFHLSSSHPWQLIWLAIARNLVSPTRA
jgi:hypothetical protein